MRLPLRVLLSLTIVAGISLVRPCASFADPPVLPVLTPQPPAFLTCSATGDGAICRGSRVDAVAGPTGILRGTAAEQSS